MSIRSIDLNLLRVGSSHRISRWALREIANPELLVDECLESLVFSLTGFIASEDMGKREVTRYPANWLEAVKERFLPDWLKKSWPVQYTVKEVEMKILYPGLAPSLPEKEWKTKRTMRVYVNKFEPDEWGKWMGDQWGQFKEGLTP